MLLLNVLLGAVCCFIGTIFGINDCKTTFGIPKGAKPEDGEFWLYSHEENEEEVNGNILDY